MSAETTKRVFLRLLKNRFKHLCNGFIAGAGAESTENIRTDEFKFKKDKVYFDRVDLSIIDAHCKLESYIDYIEKTPADKIFKE